MALGWVGREGMLGGGAPLGAASWPYEVVFRGTATSAVRIEAARLPDACRQSHGHHNRLLSFAGNFLLPVGRTSATNLVESLERRMARWILLYHDRLGGDEVPITRQEIGIMLDMRRASATDVLHVLEGEGAVRNAGGCVIVRDRARLEEIAGQAYGDAEADYRQRIGPFGKSPHAAPRMAATG